jgi:NAD(P)-dependent dehydrogenase (short-subunit alcohol dehydrogenase family)
MIFKGKTVWVVGVTGTIGNAIQKKFMDTDATIVVTRRRDVCDLQGLIETARSCKPDILVNCAGVYGPHAPVQEGWADDWARTIEVNLIGAYNLTRAVLPHMLLKGGGKIIHMSGGGAANGRAGYSAYSASKAGLVRFVECVALEAPSIQINAIAPGSVKSRMNPEGTGTPDRAASLTLTLCDPSCTISGRLISAIHDDWEHLVINPLLEEGMLRRVPFGTKEAL